MTKLSKTAFLRLKFVVCGGDESSHDLHKYSLPHQNIEVCDSFLCVAYLNVKMNGSPHTIQSYVNELLRMSRSQISVLVLFFFFVFFVFLPNWKISAFAINNIACLHWVTFTINGSLHSSLERFKPFSIVKRNKGTQILLCFCNKIPFYLVFG